MGTAKGGGGTIVIIGAGASGMLAALSARLAERELGIHDDRLEILILERNQKPGAKIAISGGGHCNLTHDAPVDRLLEKGFLKKNEQRFVRHAIHGFTNTDLLALFRRYGVETEARPDGRVFPVSGRAADVLAAMRSMLRDVSARVVTGMRVDRIERTGAGFIVRAGEQAFAADAVILATGGASWGSSGTTGDGIRLAAALGHTTVPVMPALAPVFFAVPPKPELVGVSLRGVALVADSGKGTDSRRGDVLVSHRGVSGPACLSLSRSVAVMLAESGEPVRLSVDLFPLQRSEELSAWIVEQAGRQGARLVRTVLQRSPLAPERLLADAAVSTTIPNAFVPELMQRAGIGDDQSMGSVTRQQRNALVAAMKRFDLGRVRKVPLDRAEVSAGGVSLGEIDPKTMQSRLHGGLYCCGEVLDYAAEVGGFNLQAAFSTGWFAGRHAARRLAEG